MYRKKWVGFLLIILSIIIAAYREVQILIDRGSWKAKNYWDVFWYKAQTGWKRLFDSFHASNGLYVLIISYLLADSKKYQFFTLEFLKDFELYVITIIYWITWMYVRNIGMHIIFKKEPEWKYLMPIKFIQNII